MPVTHHAASVYNVTLTLRDAVPLVRGWNRLEGRPRSAEFARSLRAEVRDPLWFLARQWQYGEFEGEDAGSPIDARLAYTTAALDGYAVGEATLPYDPATPLEVRVESEAVPFDLVLHMQASRMFERLLRERGRETRFPSYVTLFALDYDAGVAGEGTPEARALFEAGKDHLLDSAQLIAAVRDDSHAARIAGFPGLTAAESAELDDAAGALSRWYERTYSHASGESAAWRSDRLDYAFACTGGGGAVRVSAGEYRGGELDWHAFDVAASTGVTTDASAARTEALSFLPAAIRFAGMPSPRYWELEDSRTDFGALDINANDLARLLFAEFLLVFSNDWCLLPLELDVGSFTRLEGLLVTDVFGEQTLVRAADRGRDSDWQRWSMYRLDGDDTASMGLLLAPTLTAAMASPAFEQVHFLRDEMANMVWAVEHRLPSKLSEPFDPELGAEAPPTPVATEGAHYRLGQTIPPNWRPFIPAHLPGSTRSIRLQRARMPGQPQELRGHILNVPTPYFVAEEEVPRAGRKVTRCFQRARWIDGATWLWIGRASPIGRGEGSSGLEFDTIEEGRGGTA